MIDISDPLPNSKPSLNTIHDILLDGKRIGYVEVGYLRKEDVKTFQKYAKRKLKAGKPFGVQVFIDAVGGGVGVKELGEDRLQIIVKEIVRKFEGLEERDIHIIELAQAGKKVIGRASELSLSNT